MPISSPVFKPSNVSVDIINATNARTTNLALPAINTEVSHALIDNLKQIIIRNRLLVDLKFSFTSGESGTEYTTLKGGAVLTLSDLDFNSKTIYIQSGTITTIEILELYT